MTAVAFTHSRHGGKSDRCRGARPGQGFRRRSRRRRGQPVGSDGQHQRHPWTQWRGQDHHYPHAAGHYRADRGDAQPAWARTPVGGSARGRLFARGTRALPGDDCGRGDRVHGRASWPADRHRAQARGRIARGARLWRLGQAADPHPVQGHGADRAIARHDRPQAAADRSRRAIFRARRDQPGKARATHSRRGGGGNHRDFFDPCHRPCRAPVRARRDHRRGQGRLRRRGRRGARAAAPDRPFAHARRRRAVARRRFPPRRRGSAASGASNFRQAAPNPCSRRCSTARPGSRR